MAHVLWAFGSGVRTSGRGQEDSDSARCVRAKWLPRPCAATVINEGTVPSGSDAPGVNGLISRTDLKMKQLFRSSIFPLERDDRHAGDSHYFISLFRGIDYCPEICCLSLRRLFFCPLACLSCHWVSGFNPHFLTACQTAAPFGCQVLFIILFLMRDLQRSWPTHTTEYVSY